MNALLGIFGIGILAMSITMKKSDYKYWTKYDAMFKEHAAKNGLDWKMLKAIAMNESSLGQDSRVERKEWSSDGKSRGLMQLTLPTARDFELVEAKDLDDAETSVRIAAKFLHALSLTFMGDKQKIVMSYNQGAGNTLKGKLYALEYYNRWLKHYKTVEENS